MPVNRPTQAQLAEESGITQAQQSMLQQGIWKPRFTRQHPCRTYTEAMTWVRRWGNHDGILNARLVPTDWSDFPWAVEYEVAIG